MRLHFGEVSFPSVLLPHQQCTKPRQGSKEWGRSGDRGGQEQLFWNVLSGAGSLAINTKVTGSYDKMLRRQWDTTLWWRVVWSGGWDSSLDAESMKVSLSRWHLIPGTKGEKEAAKRSGEQSRMSEEPTRQRCFLSSWKAGAAQLTREPPGTGGSRRHVALLWDSCYMRIKGTGFNYSTSVQPAECAK